MDLSCLRRAGLARTSDPHAQKIWAAHLRKPLCVPGNSALSLQLPPGDYELSECDDIHYALYASPEFSVILRVTEVDCLRASGALAINGSWP